MKTKALFAYMLLLPFAATSCSGTDVVDPNFTPPDAVIHPEKSADTDSLLPQAGAAKAYSPSLIGKMYRPIQVSYSSQYPPVSSWNTADTRVIPFMEGYTPQIKSEREYKAITNKYGSYTGKGKQTATGRFYTKKIGNRWWIIDPEGYPHYERSTCSFRQGSSARNKAAWTSRFGSVAAWAAKSQAELASIGFHGIGAFSTDGYSAALNHNKSNPSAPIIISPSFGFLRQFANASGIGYPGGSSSNLIGVVINSQWPSWCKTYAAQVLAPYKNDPNVLGIFSDNEINFTSNADRVLDRFLNIKDHNDAAYVYAAKFMSDKGATSVTDELNDEFAGQLAELYYKGVKEAITSVDPQMLYLGTRLHGKPKYMEHVVRAAGKYCDIISINYYSRWSPELDTYVKDWATWADKPFIVSEFYTKAADSELSNQSGAGLTVPSQKERAWAYQHFTLGLLEAPNCVGWHWFKYQDDDGNDNDGKPANKGIYDNNYEMYPYLTRYMRQLNFNVYNLIDYFDN